MLMKIVRKNQRGIGLLELMLSLSIIAVLLVMATRYFVVTNRNQKINQTISTLNSVVGAANIWKGNRPTYTGMDAKTLFDAGLIPAQEFDRTNNKIATGLGNMDIDASAVSSYTLTIPGLDDWACNGLESKFANPDGTVNPNAECDAQNAFVYKPANI